MSCPRRRRPRGAAQSGEVGGEHAVHPGVVQVAAAVGDLPEGGHARLLREEVQDAVAVALVVRDEVRDGGRDVVCRGFVTPRADVEGGALAEGGHESLLRPNRRMTVWLDTPAAAVTTVPRMDYEHTISEVVKGVEAVGAGIMVFGGLWALVLFVPRALKADAVELPYDELRRNLGRAILLGLEVLIVADIVRTIIVDPTLESVAVLGGSSSSGSS
ncbi:DUF1622 domain-containing protein [Svornostia abyssi]|uniref:DUF1622 domain-containing protein n=1 Tax=Svornostia abyssi TaxID=2898438 RepID=A0ABY5PGD7_9ACTN|nr:DUF1622 domain-containing protein [Parviterribacteraceae bacterium J379]